MDSNVGIYIDTVVGQGLELILRPGPDLLDGIIDRVGVLFHPVRDLFRHLVAGLLEHVVKLGVVGQSLANLLFDGISVTGQGFEILNVLKTLGDALRDFLPGSFALFLESLHLIDCRLHLLEECVDVVLGLLAESGVADIVDHRVEDLSVLVILPPEAHVLVGVLVHDLVNLVAVLLSDPADVGAVGVIDRIEFEGCALGLQVTEALNVSVLHLLNRGLVIVLGIESALRVLRREGRKALLAGGSIFLLGVIDVSADLVLQIREAFRGKPLPGHVKTRRLDLRLERRLRQRVLDVGHLLLQTGDVLALVDGQEAIVKCLVDIALQPLTDRGQLALRAREIRVRLIN